MARRPSKDKVNGGSSVKAGKVDIDCVGATANASRVAGGMASVSDFFGTKLTASSLAFTSDAACYPAADVKGIGNGGSGPIGTKSHDRASTSEGSRSIKQGEAA